MAHREVLGSVPLLDSKILEAEKALRLVCFWGLEPCPLLSCSRGSCHSHMAPILPKPSHTDLGKLPPGSVYCASASGAEGPRASAEHQASRLPDLGRAQLRVEALGKGRPIDFCQLEAESELPIWNPRSHNMTTLSSPLTCQDDPAPSLLLSALTCMGSTHWVTGIFSHSLQHQGWVVVAVT